MADDRPHTARRFLPAPNAQRPTPSRRPPATLSPVYPRGNKNLSHFCVGHCTAVGIRLCVLTAAALGAIVLAAPAADAASIRVPLDRDHPGLGRITVRYAVVRHTDRSQPPLEPMWRSRAAPATGRSARRAPTSSCSGSSTARHDLIVMDQRGTGSIGGHRLPGAPGRGCRRTRTAAAACARRLRRTANAYGTGAVADDMAAILRRLRVPEVDVYGDSYGTYAAQVFAVRHPNKDPGGGGRRRLRQRVRPVRARESRSRCARPGAPSAPARDSARTSWGRSGRWHAGSPRTRSSGPGRTPTVCDGTLGSGRSNFGNLVYDATYTYTVFRDLPGALVALRHGDRAPMLRLAAEDVAFDLPGGSPSSYSVGDYLAVACHDYPTVWSKADRPPAAGRPWRTPSGTSHRRVRAVPEARLAPHRRRARARAGLSRLAAAADRSDRRSLAAARGRRCRCSS